MYKVSGEERPDVKDIYYTIKETIEVDKEEPVYSIESHDGFSSFPNSTPVYLPRALM
jgi:hypothetical protein